MLVLWVLWRAEEEREYISACLLKTSGQLSLRSIKRGREAESPGAGLIFQMPFCLHPLNWFVPSYFILFSYYIYLPPISP